MCSLWLKKRKMRIFVLKLFGKMWNIQSLKDYHYSRENEYCEWTQEKGWGWRCETIEANVDSKIPLSFACRWGNTRIVFMSIHNHSSYLFVYFLFLRLWICFLLFSVHFWIDVLHWLIFPPSDFPIQPTTFISIT